MQTSSVSHLSVHVASRCRCCQFPFGCPDEAIFSFGYSLPFGRAAPPHLPCLFRTEDIFTVLDGSRLRKSCRGHFILEKPSWVCWPWIITIRGHAPIEVKAARQQSQCQSQSQPQVSDPSRTRCAPLRCVYKHAQCVTRCPRPWPIRHSRRRRLLFLFLGCR